MNILVTGGAGYIGSHVVRKLLIEEHEVVVLDDLSTGHEDFVPDNVPLYKTELDMRFHILDCLTKYSIDTVIHLAAVTSVEESQHKPLFYYAKNVGSTIGLLEAMQQVGVKRFIFGSSASVCGYVADSIYPAEPDMPKNPYGWSKWFIEQALADMEKAYPPFQYRILRCCNVGGASDDGTLGERHSPETHLIPTILSVALGQQEAVPINPVSQNVRHYVHVEDVADAFVAAVASLDEEWYDNPPCHICGTKSHTVQEVIQEAAIVTGKTIPTTTTLRQGAEPTGQMTYDSLGLTWLPWGPKYGLREIIESAWKWHQKEAERATK